MIIGITGKSGSGKSTLAKKISGISGFVYFDIDTICHNVIESKMYNETIELFGNVFDDNKHIVNRVFMGDKIFSNRNNQLYKTYSLHVYINMVTWVKDTMGDTKSNGYILDHILLPHEPELWNMCDVKILMNTPDEVRKCRVIKRDNITPEYFLLREASSIEYTKSDFNYIITSGE